jgi:hypothetical protein
MDHIVPIFIASPDTECFGEGVKEEKTNESISTVQIL